MFWPKINEVLASRKSFISDRLNYLSLGASLLINIIHWVILFFKIKPGDDSILLHYNIIYGADYVDQSKYIYLIPATALVMLIVNIIFSVYVFRREKIASYFINFVSIPVQLIFITASIVLINVNE